MKKHRFIREIGRKIGEISKDVCSDYMNNELPSEREFNTILADRIKNKLNETTKNNIEFYSRVFSSQKEGSEESKIGADLGIVLEYNLKNYNISKGVIVQSKTCNNSTHRCTNISDLPTQVNKMLKLTSDSFVFVFPVDNQVRVVPALALDAQNKIPNTFIDEKYDRNIQRFFELFLECFIGDHKIVEGINETESYEKKEELIFDKINVQNVLYIQAENLERNEDEN